ncbi:MAG: flagellar biosynthesis protein FlhB [Candidatus Desulfofervidus auxilii]|nr:flagellar biosynthesis protein FlhB [Candidatus Desulfofervidus auxilii]
MPWFREEDKTEPATPKRREEARSKGQVARSQEIPSAFIILGSTLVLYFCGNYMCRQLVCFSKEIFIEAGRFPLNDVNFLKISILSIKTISYIMCPLFVTLVIIGFSGNCLQTGFLFTTYPIIPDISRINPINGIKRLFSMSSFIELIKSLFKLLLIGFVTYRTIKSELPYLSMLSTTSYYDVFVYTAKITLKLCLQVGLIMCILAIADYCYQRYEYEEGLKMTKQEVKEEYKEREGDPKIKARLRSMQRQLARRRMLQEVPKADVVITNPTLIAVALKYTYGEMPAPQVVAKGAGFLAEKIKQIAITHNIMIVENKWLAQILYRTVNVGDFIPPKLYQAVAEVLAYVYQIKGRRIAV